MILSMSYRTIHFSLIYFFAHESGPVCAMVWEGKNVVLEGRKMLGATMPSESAMGTIR